MQYINIHDAKTNLSKYLEQVYTSNTEMVICNNGKPIAYLSKYKPHKPRKLGLLKGKINISDDFDELPENFQEHFRWDIY